MAADRAQGLQLPGHVGNAEIDVAIAFGALQVWRQIGGAAGQHGVAKGADGEPRAPEGDADTGAENGTQDGWSARNVDLPGMEVDLWQFGRKFHGLFFLLRLSPNPLSCGRARARRERAASPC